jgi:hypothetical protein
MRALLCEHDFEVGRFYLDAFLIAPFYNGHL